MTGYPVNHHGGCYITNMPFLLLFLPLKLCKYCTSTETSPELLSRHSSLRQAGPYWTSLLDNYGANFAMLLFAFLLTGGLSWGYGIRRFINDIRTMIGDRYVDTLYFKWWPLNWVVLTPLSMGVSFPSNKNPWVSEEGFYPP